MIVKLNLDNQDIYRVVSKTDTTLILAIGDDLTMEVPKRVCEVVPPCVTVVMLDDIPDTTEGRFYPAYPVKVNQYVLKNDAGKIIELSTASVAVVQEGLNEELRGGLK